MRLFVRNLLEKVPHDVQGSKPITKVNNVSQVLFESLFSFGQCECLRFGFTKFLYIFKHTKCLSKLQHTLDLENFGFNGFGPCNVCSSDSPNFHNYLSIQNVYANYNKLWTLKIWYIL